MLTECEIVMRTLEDEIDCETNNRNPTFLINYYSTYIEQEEQYNKGELTKLIVQQSMHQSFTNTKIRSYSLCELSIEQDFMNSVTDTNTQI